jgi:hypothetical protein
MGVAHQAVSHHWINVQPTTTPDIASVAFQALRPLRELFRSNDDNDVVVKLFSSSIRGDNTRVTAVLKPNRRHSVISSRRRIQSNVVSVRFLKRPAASIHERAQ